MERLALTRFDWRPLLATAPAGLLVLQVWLTTGFVYSLDDPYIHLALARQILHGHYGINPGEFAAPSSSILWPFLLVPFARTGFCAWAPLAINMAALYATMWWLQRWLVAYTSPPRALVAAIAIAILLNLYGLVMTGMEHSLQLALVAVIGISIVQSRHAWPLWSALILLPLIRYEGLAISLPVLAWLALDPARRGGAVAAGLAIAAAVAGFSLFLHLNGVGWLPSSVLAKKGLGFAPDIEGLIRQTPFLVFAIVSGWLYVREGRPRDALLLVAAPTLLHLAFGRYGWFGRYHVYFVLWTLILFIPPYLRAPFVRTRTLTLSLAACFIVASYDTASCTFVTAMSARNVNDQQGQMAILARDFLDEPIAVNDIGLVSFRARHYVLDLYGLASYEALKARVGSANDSWIPDLMARHHVEQAMIYDAWFPHRPAGWIRVATLRLPSPRIVVAFDEVAFYASNSAAAARLRKALAAYRQSSPQAALMLALTEP
jgi:hypothetical protein